MEPGIFARGLLIGLSIAAPVGPIGVLCIRRTLADGRLAGLTTGLGAATADAAYGVVAGFGVTVITRLLLAQEFWIRLIGGLFLCYLGAKTFVGTPAVRPAVVAGGRNLAGAYTSALALTLTNPLTMLSFVAIFAGLGAGAAASSAAASLLMVFGVLIGSALWWLILTGAVGLLRSRLTAPRLRWVNRLSGAVLLVFGAVALLSLWR
jgi:threonine/homoserine/homoserine lactone efflux protein